MPRFSRAIRSSFPKKRSAAASSGQICLRPLKSLRLSSAPYSSLFTISEAKSMIRRKVGLALFWCLLTVVLRPTQCGAQQTGETRPVSTAQGKDESGTALPLTDEDTNTGTDMSADQPSVSNYENSIGIKFVKHLASDQVTIWTSRSEERRVGKECRWRWRAYD